MPNLTFDQLSDRAKARAIDQYRSWDIGHDWWTETYALTKQVGDYIGIVIDDDVTLPESKRKPNIQFSGFWSQGDGCCFTGEIIVPKISPEARVWIHEDDLHGTTDMLRRGVRPLIDLSDALYSEIIAVEVADALDPDNEEWPECRSYSSIQLIGNARGYFHTDLRHGELYPDSVGNLAEKFAEAFAAWIYKELRTAHDDITSDEAVSETLIASEYLFTETGKIILG